MRRNLMPCCSKHKDVTHGPPLTPGGKRERPGCPPCSMPKRRVVKKVIVYRRVSSARQKGSAAKQVCALAEEGSQHHSVGSLETAPQPQCHCCHSVDSLRPPQDAKRRS